jgi:alanyl-tRNA synthetase
MSEAYPHLAEQRAEILATFEKEETLFRQTLNRGLKEFDKLIGAVGKEENGVTKFELFLGGEQIFYLYETYGFPPEMTIEELKNTSKSRGLVFTEQTEQVLMLKFQRENQKHQEQSRAGAEQKFKGGLADHSEEVIKLHTAHHLLLRALQIVVGDHVKQRGSNITGERLRIDFSNPDKLTDEQVARVEQIVNEKIQAGLSVERREMPKSEAESIGAEMEFGQKYPDIVTVYVITDTDGTAFSKEFCGGPHVANTSEIGAGGKTFKIQKQENVGSGVRRIKAALV